MTKLHGILWCRLVSAGVVWAGWLAGACSTPLEQETPPQVDAQTLVALPCTDSTASIYSAPAGLPPYDATRRGDVVRCARGTALSMQALSARLVALDVADREVHGGVEVFRIVYRTERLAGQPGLSSAVVVLPERPIASTPPLIVFAHGAAGPSSACAPTRDELARSTVPESGALLLLAGYGYPVIMPDYAGYLADDPMPQGVFLAEDEAHSVLDATRAMHKLLGPDRTSQQVVLVGHSQGGHAVLSAQALARSYGLAGELVSVLAFAPVWFPARAMGAIIAPAAGFTTSANAGVIGLAVGYFYSHAELYDGPGSGRALFQAKAREAVQAFFHSETCESATLAALGETTSDFIEPEFLSSIAGCGLGGDCMTGPAATWKERFVADRPQIDPDGADVVLWQGGADDLVSPPLAQCGIDKLSADVAEVTGKFEVCADRDADHQTIMSRHMAWAARHIEARTLGANLPDACPGHEELEREDRVLSCPNPPGNED